MTSYYKILPKGKPEKTIDLLVKVDSQFDPQLNNETIDFDGIVGSTTVHQGSGGGELKISPVFQLKIQKDISAVKSLQSWWENGTIVTIVYASGEKHAGLLQGGDYKITKTNIKEPFKGFYEVDLTLQKQTVFPVTYKTFTNWKPPATTSTASKKDTKSSLYSTLAKCKLPLYLNHAGKNKSTNCDLVFQKLLRLFGFYLKYNGKSLKLDGYYGVYTGEN